MNQNQTLLNDADLLAYLDEMLPVEKSAEIEELVRARPEIRVQLMALIRQRDQGAHTVGEIWRRHRLSCPPRTQLGTFLLGVASPSVADYIHFHLHEIGCRVCLANVADLSASLSETAQPRQSRQQRYFESSAGLLRARREE